MCLLIAVSILLILIISSFGISAGTSDSAAAAASGSSSASGSVGAGYNALCAMPSQCASGKCVRQADGSHKCGCKYDRECGTGQTCTTATGQCTRRSDTPGATGLSALAAEINMLIANMRIRLISVPDSTLPAGAGSPCSNNADCTGIGSCIGGICIAPR